MEAKVIPLNRQGEKIVNLGKFWVALKNEKVIGFMSMKVPADANFDLFRNRAKACLSVLGEVKAGELIKRDEQVIFLKRLTHVNRGKKKRTPQEFKLSDSITLTVA